MEYIVYVKPNENGYIAAVNSSEFLIDNNTHAPSAYPTGWKEIQ